MSRWKFWWKVRISGHNLNISVMCTVHPGKLRWLGGKSAYYPILPYILIGNTLTYIGCFFHCNGRYFEGHTLENYRLDPKYAATQVLFSFPSSFLENMFENWSFQLSNLQKKKQAPPCLTIPAFSNPYFSCPWRVAKPPKGKDRLPLQSFFRGELLNFGRVKKTNIKVCFDVAWQNSN